MTPNYEETLLTERYRPQTIDDLVITEDMRKKIKEWIKEEEIPNLLLVSKQPGIGKTSLSNVLVHEIKTDAKFINMSLEKGIDVIRQTLDGFVTTVGFSDKPKIVVLDEVDGVQSDKFQKSLRGFLENYSKTARFILTANYREKIIEPLQNRFFFYIWDDTKPEVRWMTSFDTTEKEIHEFVALIKELLK